LAGEVALPRLREVLQLLTRRRYLLLVGGYAAQTFSIGAFAYWGPSFLHRLHGLSIGRADWLFGVLLAGTGLAATLLGGFIANLLRKRSESGYVWLMAVSMFLLFLPTGPITTEMLEIVPTHLRASAVALCTFFIHLLGDFSSPAVVGQVSEQWHSLRVGAMTLPVVLAVGAVLWVALLANPAKERA
jgi:sugar phosphate permease